MVPKLDAVIVGGGAAGIATAIFTARELPTVKLAILDGARRLGAKILVSGGGRCNVSNRKVSAFDFSGGSPAAIRHVLQALPVRETIEFFEGLGVPLHEEECGKLFPDTNRASTVLNALVSECRSRGVLLLTGHRVDGIRSSGEGFEITCRNGTDPAQGSGRFVAANVVLATGGRSLPKSGSDGFGYQLAERFGHRLVPVTPALVPLTLGSGFHTALSGISQAVELTLTAPGKRPRRTSGPMLWTHFGISGPAVLDMSRHWLRDRLEGRDSKLTANLLPGCDFHRAEELWLELTREHPRLRPENAMARWIPAGVAEALCGALSEPTRPLGQLAREERRRLLHLVTALPLEVRESRGYNYAEVTAGGIALNEVDPRTMQSRVCPGLFLVGEILDVDGRLGGFNFQWAWSSARAAASGIRLRLTNAQQQAELGP